jgi:hypothetical protein
MELIPLAVYSIFIISVILILLIISKLIKMTHLGQIKPKIQKEYIRKRIHNKYLNTVIVLLVINTLLLMLYPWIVIYIKKIKLLSNIDTLIQVLFLYCSFVIMNYFIIRKSKLINWNK